MASVRVNPAPIEVYPFPSWSGRRFTATHVSMEILLGYAYGDPDQRIHGLPSWKDTMFYDVDAKAVGQGDLPLTVRRAMLQALLKERFHLAAHRETKEVSGYALVVANSAKKQPTLTASDGLKPGSMYRDKVRFPGISMTGFASILERLTHEPVQDKTGIAGNYSISLDFAPLDCTESPLPSLYTALEEQLGLKLVSQKVPVDELIVDHVDQSPTEN